MENSCKLEEEKQPVYVSVVKEKVKLSLSFNDVPHDEEVQRKWIRT
jgi:hypothetical protein